MDDTICDFMTPWIKDVKNQLNYLRELKLLGKWSALESLIIKIQNFLDNGTKLHLTEEEKKYFIYPQSRIGFLLNLEPIPGAKETIAKLQQHFDIKILTKPSYLNPHCYTEKRLWVEKHYGLDMCQHLYFAPDKTLMKGDYLIDDILWEGFEGIQLQIGQPDLSSWDKVYDRIMELEFDKSK